MTEKTEFQARVLKKYGVIPVFDGPPKMSRHCGENRRISGVQCLERYIRRNPHDLEQGSSGSGRVASMLFPVL